MWCTLVGSRKKSQMTSLSSYDEPKVVLIASFFPSFLQFCNLRRKDTHNIFFCKTASCICNDAHFFDRLPKLLHLFTEGEEKKLVPTFFVFAYFGIFFVLELKKSFFLLQAIRGRTRISSHETWKKSDFFFEGPIAINNPTSNCLLQPSIRLPTPAILNCIHFTANRFLAAIHA